MTSLKLFYIKYILISFICCLSFTFGQTTCWVTSDVFIGGKQLTGQVYEITESTGNNFFLGRRVPNGGGKDTAYLDYWNGINLELFADEAYFTGSHNIFIFTICQNGNNVYVGGSFDKVGNKEIKFLAMWNGIEWSKLGEGLGGEFYDAVNSIVVNSKGDVFVAGIFQLKGQTGSVALAKWDGQSWQKISNGLFGNVRVLRLDANDNLYVGGEFTISGNPSCKNIAKWDGTSWSPLGQGVNNLVKDIGISSEGKIYIAGYFTKAGETIVNYIAEWDGSQWQSLGTGLKRLDGFAAFANTIAVGKKNEVYVGGNFTAAGNIEASRIAKWNGTEWLALGTGVNGKSPSVLCSAIMRDGGLLIGGSFTEIDSKITSNLALYYDQTVWINENIIFNEFNLFQNYPNPFNPNTTISYFLKYNSDVTLKIFNSLGEEVKTLVDNENQNDGMKKIFWDGKNFKGEHVGSGVYFYKVITSNFIQTKKMILLK